MKNLKITNVIPFFIGILSFFIIYGSCILNPENIGWLSEGDPLTYYLGWSFFRKSDWTFPIGLNPDYGLEISNSIVYSDSNSLLAIFFKFFSSVLPDTFQYFGLWMLICFILQAWFGWKLTKIISENIFICIAGTLLFVFCPVLIFRFGHINLCSHFLILASLFLIFSKKLQYRRLKWGILFIIAISTHAYLLVMTVMMWVADLLDRKAKGELVRKQIYAELITLISIILCMAYVLGYFSVIHGIVAEGYGYYRMNILSIINPTGYSYLLKDIPVGPGDYEGFNYPGLGVLFLLISSIPAVFRNRGQIGIYILKYKYLCAILILLSLFSITNEIGLGPYTLHVPFYMKIFNMFRASGRFFWPVLYTFIFFILFVNVRFYSKNTSIILLSIAVLFQVVDTSAGWLPRKKILEQQSHAKYISSFRAPFWHQIVGNYRKLRFIMPTNMPKNWQDMARLAYEYNLKTDVVYLGRVDKKNYKKLKARAEEIIESGNVDNDTLYFLDDESYLHYLDNDNDNADVLIVNIDGYHVLVPVRDRNVLIALPSNKYAREFYNNKIIYHQK